MRESPSFSRSMLSPLYGFTRGNFVGVALKSVTMSCSRELKENGVSSSVLTFDGRRPKVNDNGVQIGHCGRGGGFLGVCVASVFPGNWTVEGREGSGLIIDTTTGVLWVEYSLVQRFEN